MTEPPMPPNTPPPANPWGPANVAQPPVGSAYLGGPGGFAPAPPKPGPIPLRPLTVSELLDGAITTVRSHPKATFGLSAVLALVATVAIGLPLTLLTRWGLSYIHLPSTFTQEENAQISLGIGDVTSALMLTLPTWLGGLFATGILTALVGQAVLGRPVSAADSWQRARPRLWALLGISLLQAASTVLIGALAFGLAITPIVVAAVLDQPWWILLSIPLLAVAVLVMALMTFVFSLTPPVIVLERVGPVAAIARVWNLLRTQWLRTFGIWILIQILMSVLSGIVAMPLSLGASVTAALRQQSSGLQWLFSLLGDVFTALGAAVTSIVLWPLTSAMIALIYLSMRMRREGLDLVLTRVARGEPGAPADPYATTSTPTSPATQFAAPPFPPAAPPHRPGPG